MASTMFGMTGQQNNGFNIQKFQNDLNNLKATGMNPRTNDSESYESG